MARSSIVIPVFNKASLTRQCLDELFRESATGLEIIVVDDASTDDTAKMLAGYGERIRVVTHTENKGFAVSCNDGAAVAHGEFLVFLNNDTIPTAGWLKALENYALDHPEAAAVGAKLLFPDNTIQHAGVTILSQNRFPSHIYTGFPADHPAVNKSRRFQVVTAGCILIPRDLFTQAGGFDRQFHNGYEDVDLCLRFGEMGHEIHYCHESVLYHLESRTRDITHPTQSENEKLYAARWAGKVHADDFQYYIQDGLLTVHCTPLFPIYIEASPQLAIHSPWGSPSQAERMLLERARQVHHLLQENIGLLVRAREMEEALSFFKGQNGMSNGPGSASSTSLAEKPARDTPSLPRLELLSSEERRLRLPGLNGNVHASNESGAVEAIRLKAEVEALKAQQAHDQLQIAALRDTISDLHRKLMQRDQRLIEVYHPKATELVVEKPATNEPVADKLEAEEKVDLSLHLDSERKVTELLGFMDSLNLAVTQIYQSRRWKWANFSITFRGLFTKSDSVRGYWRIDEILTRYREWRKNAEASNEPSLKAEVECSGK